MVQANAIAALGAENMAKVCDLTEDQMEEAAKEVAEERKLELERQKSMGTLMLGVALCSFYFMWLQGVVPPHLDWAAQRLGFARFVRVEDLSAALGMLRASAPAAAEL